MVLDALLVHAGTHPNSLLVPSNPAAAFNVAVSMFIVAQPFNPQHVSASNHACLGQRTVQPGLRHVHVR
jgi:hypothetical protein